jgi:hypothetical protein
MSQKPSTMATVAAALILFIVLSAVYFGVYVWRLGGAVCETASVVHHPVNPTSDSNRYSQANWDRDSFCPRSLSINCCFQIG